MNRIFDITRKDIIQTLRDRKTFMFLLLMPLIFTVFFAFAFGSMYKGPADSRLPVGFLDQDGSALSQKLLELLSGSSLIRLDINADRTAAELDQLVEDGKLAAAVILPAGYGEAMQSGQPLPLTFIADQAQGASITIQSDVNTAAGRLASAVKIAGLAAQASGDGSIFSASLDRALAAWQNPPIQLEVTSGATGQVAIDPNVASAAQSSPGMMLQFAIAGLITAATVIVNERKSRSLQRLLTTPTSRVQILLGHYLTIFSLIMIQFIILIVFGALVLKVDYFRVPLATALVAFCSAACISALGLLIGVLAHSEEQTVIFALIPMFVLAGLGGAWVPLEITGPSFQAIGHVSPIAWAMDGFKNIAIRGLGFNSVLLPAAALFGYALLFFILAAWRFRRVSQ